ncbi:alpha/beta hydrolase [Microbacterium sp. A1-JK]|uniref:alpha/beta hydrolase n=1 Tax=Microbacterium sp. A1-JK TaxID=3177516 RepID=UPI00388B6CAB
MSIRVTGGALRLIAATVAVASLAVLAGCGGGRTDIPDPTSKVEKNITYREVEDQSLALDACLPLTTDAPVPAVVLVHGGAFQEGDRKTMSGICGDLADAGYAAFSVDYRLVPAIYPAQQEDVAAAVEWLRQPEQKQRFGLSDSVSLLGSSAGAIIVMTTAETLAGSGAPVDAVVGLSTAAVLTEAARELGSPPPELEQVVQGYLGCVKLTDCPSAVPASPVTVAASLPPTMLIHGSEELIPLAQAQTLVDALNAAGVRNELIVVDGDNHGLSLLNSKTRPSIFDFLASVQ